MAVEKQNIDIVKLLLSNCDIRINEISILNIDLN